MFRTPHTHYKFSEVRLKLKPYFNTNIFLGQLYAYTLSRNDFYALILLSGECFIFLEIVHENYARFSTWNIFRPRRSPSTLFDPLFVRFLRRRDVGVNPLFI